MIVPQPLGADGQVRVTFTLPAVQADATVSVVGDFNEWDPKVLRMRRRGATRSAQVVLNSGRTYAFRYLNSDGRWFDDDEVAEFEPNGFGGANCVIDLTVGA